MKWAKPCWRAIRVVVDADDRPYGLIQATATRDDAPAPGPAWDLQQGWLA